MAYLQARYLNRGPTDPVIPIDHLEGIDAFVAFCRKELATNQPVSMEYIDAGLAIRFQDSAVVPFVNAAPGSTMADNGPAKGVSYSYGGQGIVPSRSFPITTGDKK